MELSILYFIQNLHNRILDKLMVFVSTISNHGEIWILTAVLIICFCKSKKHGIAVLLSLIMAHVIGNQFLKSIFSRNRPFLSDDSITLLIKPPSGFSFPSGHTYTSFAVAVTIFLAYKKAGIPAVILASLIAFSRMYLFVHYPTDILAGIVLGIVTAILSTKLVDYTDVYLCHKKTLKT